MLFELGRDQRQRQRRAVHRARPAAATRRAHRRCGPRAHASGREPPRGGRCRYVRSGTMRSTPSRSGPGNITPASITIVVSPQETAIMFMPNSPTPPSGTISSASLDRNSSSHASTPMAFRLGVNDTCPGHARGCVKSGKASGWKRALTSRRRPLGQPERPRSRRGEPPETIAQGQDLGASGAVGCWDVLSGAGRCSSGAGRCSGASRAQRPGKGQELVDRQLFGAEARVEAGAGEGGGGGCASSGGGQLEAVGDGLPARAEQRTDHALERRRYVWSLRRRQELDPDHRRGHLRRRVKAPGGRVSSRVTRAWTATKIVSGP